MSQTFEFHPPDYRNSGLLADIVPAAALALNAHDAIDGAAADRAAKLGLDTEARVVVIALIDGLGLELLKSSWGYAPFLRSHRNAVGQLSAGFPSTTANSLSSLGTGKLPGGHGVMGYKLLDPERDRVFNQLKWDTDRDPHTWVPDDTLFERLSATGIDVVSLGEPKFVGRGLNEASLRGGRFCGSNRMSQRVQHAIAEAKAPGKRLIYFYWGGLDKIGHGSGTDSWEWSAELENIDQALSQLANGLPHDALMLVTADHGMVNVDLNDRIDLKAHPEESALIRAVGGEPRAVHLYTRAGTTADAHAAFSALLGERGIVMTRDEAVAAGWFGPVSPANLERVGDLVAVCAPQYAIVDSAHDSPSALMLRGHHGGVSAAELLIPLLALRS